MIIVCRTFDATTAVLIAVLGSGVDSVNGFYISKSHPDSFPDTFAITRDVPVDVQARLMERLSRIPDITIENEVLA